MALVLVAGAATAGRVYVPVEQRLSPEQMHATGLDGLSPDQLALLNQLLSEERSAAITQAVEETAREHKPLPDAPISSSIKGLFRGWQAGTVFDLENGQRWRVENGDYYHGRGTQNPKATVRPGKLGGWYLWVEGVRVGARVKRVEP
ncbi:hypothetical protein [Lysobacter terrae]